MEYFDNIRESIYFYEINYGRSPDAIFISSPLFCRMMNDVFIECCREEPFHRCCGIPVKMYSSLNEEYYLAEGAYWFE